MSGSYPQGDKSTWQAQADAIRSGSIEVSESDIPMLLEWLQDLNWPGAETVAEFLVKFGPSLADPIRNVLHSGDHVWINWVLTAFKNKFDLSFWKPLTGDLEMVTRTPDEEGAHVVAMTLLAKWHLIPTAQLKASLTQAKNSGDLDGDDYSELEQLLSSP